MALKYRMSTPSDRPELLKLWEEHSGWGSIDPESWDHIALGAPFGKAAFALATDRQSGKIVGQFGFVPFLVSIQGRQITALRPYAPILNKEVRSTLLNPLGHPIVKMYLHAVKALKGRGDGLIYMLPDPRWGRLFRMIPFFHTGTFPLMSLKLPLDGPPVLEADYIARPLVVLDERVDSLWQRASRLYGCMVVRDSRTLPWKLGMGAFTVTGVERGGELVGIVTTRKKGDRQWLICDLLAADAGGSMKATLTAGISVANKASETAPADDPILKVGVLATPLMEPILRELGFVRDNYNFPLAIQILDPSIISDDVAPANWYISDGD